MKDGHNNGWRSQPSKPAGAASEDGGNRYLRSAAQRGLISQKKGFLVGTDHGFLSEIPKHYDILGVTTMVSCKKFHEFATKWWSQLDVKLWRVHPPFQWRRKPWQQLPSEQLKLRSNWRRLQQKRRENSLQTDIAPRKCSQVSSNPWQFCPNSLP